MGDKNQFLQVFTARRSKQRLSSFLGFLISLTCALTCPLSAEPVSNAPLTEVIFDGAEPDLSVAVIDGELYQLGDLYEDAQILGFYSQAVILKNLETSESVKCPVFETRPDAAVHQRALHLFISKQMKAIYEAQINYRHRFGDVYAEKIDTLVEQGFLKGFSGGVKEGYSFQIVETGQTQRLAMFPREATFRVLAEPLEPSEGSLYFTVNQLGEVRYAGTKFEASWGPVWDYNNPNAVPDKDIIREI